MTRLSLISTFLVLALVVGGVLIASCLPDPHSLVGRPCDAEHACGEPELVCCDGTCQLAAEAGACDVAEPPDAGDGGRDGGGMDGGLPDGGLGDGGALDGGMDGGTDDAGTVDAGPGDAGTGDGGTGTDAGSSMDGGLPDAGTDAGCPPNLLTTGGFERSTDMIQYARTGAASISRVSTQARTGSWSVQVQWVSSDPDTFYGVQLSESAVTPVKAGTTYCLALWFKRGNVRGEMRLNSRRFSGSAGGDYDRTYEHSVGLVPPDDAWFPLIGVMVPTSTFNYSVNFRTSVTPSAGSPYFVDDARVWESPTGECEARCAQ